MTTAPTNGREAGVCDRALTIKDKQSKSESNERLRCRVNVLARMAGFSKK